MKGFLSVIAGMKAISWYQMNQKCQAVLDTQETHPGWMQAGITFVIVNGFLNTIH
jgi:hypothetical protein